MDSTADQQAGPTYVPYRHGAIAPGVLPSSVPLDERPTRGIWAFTLALASLLLASTIPLVAEATGAFVLGWLLLATGAAAVACLVQGIVALTETRGRGRRGAALAGAAIGVGALATFWSAGNFVFWFLDEVVGLL